MENGLLADFCHKYKLHFKLNTMKNWFSSLVKSFDFVYSNGETDIFSTKLNTSQVAMVTMETVTFTVNGVGQTVSL